MGVRSNYGADTPVEKPAACLFFGSRFGVKIDDDNRRLFADIFHSGQPRSKGTVNGRHKYPPLKVQHPDAHATFGVADEKAGSGVACG